MVNMPWHGSNLGSSYNAQTDDGPICNTLVSDSATDQCGLLVYSKLRSVEESAGVSVNNIKVAAYQDGYKGIGGYGYCHYLFVTDNSPLPGLHVLSSHT